MADEEIPAYVGICKCGKCVACAVDDPKDAGDKVAQKDLAKWVAGLVKSGLRVERKTVGWCRQNVEICTCPKPPRKKRTISK